MYFSRAYAEMTACSNFREIFAKLNLMNTASKLFEISKDVLEPETVREYVAAQEKITLFLYRGQALNHCDHEEMKEFALHLITSLETDLELFHEMPIMDALGLIYATTSKSVEIVGRMQIIMDRLFPTLTENGRRNLYKKYIIYSSLDNNCFIHYQMVQPEYLESKEIKAFTNEYIGEICKHLPRQLRQDHLAGIIAILYTICKTKIVFEDRTYELLLIAMKDSIHNNFKVIHENVLITLDEVIIKITGKVELIRIVIDLLFSQHILRLVNKTTLDSTFVDVMTKCFEADRVYFKTTIEGTTGMDIYKNLYKHYYFVMMCIKNIQSLTETSSEALFNLALSSAKNLLKNQRAHQLEFRVIPEFLKDMGLFFHSLRDVTDIHYNNHPHQILGLKIIAYIVILYVEILEDEVPYWLCSKISYCIGHLMSRNHHAELIDESLPILDAIVIGLRSLKSKLPAPMTAVDLVAHMNFVKLHPLKSVAQETIDKLCFDMIISRSLKEKGYAYVKDLDYTSEAKIAVAAFKYFLQKHMETPNEEDVEHFKDFFGHLVRKRFLSLSEQLLICRIFNNFQ